MGKAFTAPRGDEYRIECPECSTMWSTLEVPARCPECGSLVSFRTLVKCIPDTPPSVGG